ncbi:hypothetical protein Tco_1541031 [Tanacetum coccineum]
MYIMSSRPRTCIPSRPRLGCDRLVSRAKVIENQVPVAPKVGAAAVASLVGVLELDTHSSSKADPSESSLPHVLVAPMVSPFLCSDDSESDTEMPERHVSSTPHNVMLARWRSRVASRSSSPTTSTLKIPTDPIPPAPSTDIISPIDAPPGIRRRRAILIRLGQDIPIGRLYRTHPESSPSDSPVTTLDRHSHSPSQYVIPSRKRCRSPATTVPSSIPTLGAIVPTRADLLPPRKRFRDSILREDSVEEDIDADVLTNIEADATVVEVTTDMDV